jgi:ribose 5-phosphate isomerase A
MGNDNEKELAGRASARFVNDGNIVGLGTGTTAVHAVHAIADRVKSGLKILGIPTSVRTGELARSLGIPLTTLDEHQEIDVTIDGADEIDPRLCLIKGGGGALLREKIIASASRKMVVIADSTKLVPVLGKFPLPVEVIGFAQVVVAKKIQQMGAKVDLRKDAAGKVYVTDEGHHILDCRFGEIPDPPALGRMLDDIPGVVEHGLFIGLASVALVGKGSAVEEVEKAER